MANLFSILDKNIKRSNKLGDWESPDIFEYAYWEIRVYLPDCIMEGIDPTINFIAKKFDLKNNFSQKDKISFYFWLKDELENVANLERMELTPVVKKKSNYKPSPRARKYSHLLELHRLSDGNPVLAEKIKKLPYEIIFDMILSIVIIDEGGTK